MDAPATVFYVEQRNLERLQSIANRLGDMQALTHDQRRDLMNLLALVVGEIRQMPVD